MAISLICKGRLKWHRDFNELHVF